MDRSPVGRLFIAWLLTIIALAAVIRFAGIGTEPIWLDEAFTYRLSSGSVEHIVRATAGDTHPPVYYLAVAGIRQAFGDSAIAVRGFSAVASLVGIVFLMLMARDIGGEWVAAGAGLLAAVNPLDVWYAQEARMYAQAAALTLACSWFLLRWWRSSSVGQPHPNKWRLWAFAYCVAALLLCGTQLIATMVLLAQGLFAVIVFVRRRRLLQAMTIAAIGLACSLTVAGWAAFVSSTRGEFASSTNLGWIPQQTLVSGLAFLVDQFFFAFSGRLPAAIRPLLTTLAWMLVVFAFGSAIVRIVVRRPWHLPSRRSGSPFLDRTYLLWLTIAPILFALAASRLFKPVYYPPRFSLFVLGPFLVLVAVACVQLRSRSLRTAIYGLFLVLMAVGTWSGARTISKRGMSDFAELWRRTGPPDVALFVPGHNRVLASYYTGETVRATSREAIEAKLRRRGCLTIWVCTETSATPSRSRDVELADWATKLGPVRELGVFDSIRVGEVRAHPTSASSPSPANSID